MLFSKLGSLEDTLVELLWEKPSTIKDLHKALPEKSSVSLRAVYKATDALVRSGVAIKVGKRLYLDQEWLRGIKERFASALPPLEAGERLAYIFSSIEHLDAFWKTIAFQFEKESSMVYFYVPHNFWSYVPTRKASEDAYYRHFVEDKKLGLFVIGGTTKADKEFKRSYQNQFIQVDTRAIASLGRRDQITVFGDWVATTRLSESLAKKIDEIYSTDRTIEELMPQILRAYDESSSARLIIEHNPAKAKKLKKILASNFVLPQ